MSLSSARARPARTRRELVATWAACIALLALVRLLATADPTGLLRENQAGVAAILFILLPERWMRAQGERWSAFGFTWSEVGWPGRVRAWGRGALFAAAVCAVAFPLFVLAFWGYGELLARVPPGLAHAVAPYGAKPAPSFRLPSGMGTFVAVQLLLVALPEELFYRGWIQTTWAATAPERRVRVLGATLGAGFVWTQALFALGHLVSLQPWRIATFFPGLLFGWVRARSDGLAAPILVHAMSNVFLAVLEASFYG